MKKMNNAAMILVEYHVHNDKQHRIYMMRMPQKEYLKRHKKELAAITAPYKKEKYINAIKEFVGYLCVGSLFFTVLTLTLYIRFI